MLKFKQLDEISQGLRDKYVAKATAAHGHYNMARRNTTGADQQYFARKEKNTQKGISRALDDKRKLSEDASSAITDSGDRRQYNSLRAMQSDRLAKAKKSKDVVSQNHTRMAQQHADAAEAILDKYRKESSDMCNVCGQTPCNCTSITEAAKDDMRTTVIKRAIAKAQRKAPVVEAAFDKEEFRRHMEQLRAREELRKTDPVSAKALDLRDRLPQASKKKPEDDSISTNDPRHPGYAYTQSGHRSVAEGANVRAGNPKAYGRDLAASETGFGKKPREDDEYHNEPKPKFKAKSLMDRPHDVHIDGKKWKSFNTGHQAHAAANTLQSKGKKAVAIARFNEEMVNPYIQEGLVDESSDKLYAGYQADVLSLKAKAAAQEKKHPVDIQKLAARLKAADTKSQGTK